MHNSRSVSVVMYDLPVKSAEERKAANRFRKELIRHGYIALQKSIYVKLLKSSGMFEREQKNIRILSPQGGRIFMMPLTLGEFSNLEAVAGESFNIGLFSDDVVCV